ncbi:MAG: hypothetical protein R2710_06145 [Acidimicrobiales bacterium]
MAVSVVSLVVASSVVSLSTVVVDGVSSDWAERTGGAERDATGDEGGEGDGKLLLHVEVSLGWGGVRHPPANGIDL